MNKDSSNSPSGNRLSIILLVGFAILSLLVMLLPGKKSGENRPRSGSRSEIVQAFFSSWDGSHRGLETSIKKSMNDPDSYEHVETRFRDDGHTIYVFTKFRGKNAFGGTIVNYAEGKLDGNTGELLEWKLLK